MTSSRAIFTFLGSLWVLYFLLVFPLAAIYRCGRNPRIGWFFRALWVFSIALLGPLSAAFYFLFYPAGRGSRPLAMVALLTVGASLIGSIFALSVAIDDAGRELSSNLAALGPMIDPGLPPQEKAAFEDHLGELKKEIETVPWTSVSQRISRYILCESLSYEEQRGELTRDYVHFWEGLFADRDRVGPTELIYRTETRLISNIAGSSP